MTNETSEARLDAVQREIISLLERALTLVDDHVAGTIAAPQICYAIDIVKQWDRAGRPLTEALQLN